MGISELKAKLAASKKIEVPTPAQNPVVSVPVVEPKVEQPVNGVNGHITHRGVEIKEQGPGFAHKYLVSYKGFEGRFQSIDMATRWLDYVLSKHPNGL